MNLFGFHKKTRHDKTQNWLDGIFFAFLKGFLIKNNPFKDCKISNR